MKSYNAFGKIVFSKALLILLSLLCSLSAYAESRWVTGTHSEELGMVLSDRIRPRIYLADSANGELVVIDSTTEEVVKRIAVDVSITDMAISKHNKRLDVVANGTVYSIELNKLSVIRTYNIPTDDGGKPVRSVAFNHNNQIFAVSLNGDSEYDLRSDIYLLNWSGTEVITTFVGDATHGFYTGLLKTDPTGTILYVGEQGVSPMSIHKFDVQNYDNPVYLGDDEHGSLGSNLKDFAVSPRYNEIYIASGSPYGIQVVDADTLEQLSIYTTGAYPAGTAISPLGDKVYGLPASPYNNYLYEYDVETDTLINEYPLLSNVLNGKAVA
jgi:DNA-binding beta-propeller fold protein YncE